MDLRLDITTNMMGPVTAPASSPSEGLGGVTNPPVMNTIGPQTPHMGPHPTNPTTLPFLNSMSGLNPGRWVWMQLESNQLHMLLTYQTELSTNAVVLVQVTGHAPIHMQWLDMWKVLLEFSPDVDLDQFVRLWWIQSTGWDLLSHQAWDTRIEGSMCHKGKAMGSSSPGCRIS